MGREVTLSSSRQRFCSTETGSRGRAIAGIIPYRGSGLAPLRSVAGGVILPMKTANETSSDPRMHCANIERQLTEISDHLRRDIERVDEPQFKALCETSAEV